MQRDLLHTDVFQLICETTNFPLPTYLRHTDYEVHYRSVNNDFINNLNAEYGEWSILPIFLPPLVNGQQQRAQMLGNQSETLQILDLECGATYELFVKQPLNNWRSELITFRTLGQAPVTPRKMDILQVVNRTLSIQLSAWLQANPQSLAPTSAPLIFKHHNRMSAVIDQSGEEFASAQHAVTALKEANGKEKVNGCPIHRFMTEYRTSNAGLWKLLNVQPADPNTLQSVELAMLNEKVIYTVRITAFTIGKPFAVAEYDVRLNDQGLADYDEFLVLDNEDSITPVNINSRAVALDQHTMFSIICSTLILLALGFVLLLLLIQRKRLLLRSSSHPDKNSSIYRKVINNGDTAASLLQSTIAYNRSVSSSIRQPISNPSAAAAALLSTAISSSSAITNSDSSTYVAAAAALQAVSSALNGANFSPRLSNSNYNQCPKLANIAAQSGLKQPLSSTNQVPELPSVPPPPLSCASKRSNQINGVYKQSTLNHRTLSKVNSKDEEITPYATFTMQADDLEPEEAGGQLPAHIQELHDMHRQLSKYNQQIKCTTTTNSAGKNSSSNYRKTNSGSEAISASVVDLFKSVKFGQSTTPQQFIRKQIDKMGISRSRTVVDREPSIDACSPSKPLRKSHNLIYGEDSNGSTFNLDRLEKKLLEEEQNDLRMFSLKVGEPGYMRYCMESNQMIGGGGGQLLAVEQHPHDILTPPASYLNTIDRNGQYKLINQLNLSQLNEINKLNNKINQINQISQLANQSMHASVKELNRPDSARAESTDSACSASALYEFSCIFNKPAYDNQEKSSSGGLMNSVQMNKLTNQQRSANKNKNLIRLINASADYGAGEESGSLISKNMINNEQEADGVTSAMYPTNDMRGGESDASSQASSDEEETPSRQISEMNSSADHLDNCEAASLTAYFGGGSSGSTANEANKNDNDNLKSNKQRNKTAGNLGRLNQGNLNSIAEPNFKAISRGRSKRPSWTDMQTMLIADQKPARKEDGKSARKARPNELDEKSSAKGQLKKQFKCSVNQGNFRIS